MKKLFLLTFLILLVVGCSKSKSRNPGAEGNLTQNTKPVMMNVPKGLLLNSETWNTTLTFQDENVSSLQVRISTAPSKGTAQLNSINDVWQFSVTPLTGSSGLDSVVVTAVDNEGAEDSFVIEYYIINPVAESAFWIRSEDIVASAAGEIITSWRNRINQQEASAVDNNKRPRLVIDANQMKSADFQFLTGDATNNDYLFYPSTYLFSQNSGVTFFVVGKNKGFSSSIAPVVSLGRWTNAGFGLSWNSQSLGLATPTSFGGADEKGIVNSVSFLNQSQIITAQVVFQNGSVPGFHRAKSHQTAWTNGPASLSLSRLTSAEIEERTTPNPSQGAPLMIGGLFNAQFQPDRRFNGEISEILILNQVLNDSEIEFFEKYFEAKYQL